MKSYTKTEVGFATLGVVFTLFGLYVIFFPDGIAFYSPSSVKSSARMHRTPLDIEIYAAKSIVYVFATIAIIVGFSMAFMALFPWKASKKDILEKCFCQTPAAEDLMIKQNLIKPTT